MYVAFIAICLLSDTVASLSLPLEMLVAAGLLVMVGLLDDRAELSVTMRFAVQIAAVLNHGTLGRCRGKGRWPDVFCKHHRARRFRHSFYCLCVRRYGQCHERPSKEATKKPNRCRTENLASPQESPNGGAKFRRQHVIGPYIVDFVCLQRHLVAEIDGGQHADQIADDSRRQRFLESQGFRVKRFWNHEVLCETDAVLEEIRLALCQALTLTLSQGERE